MKRTFIISIVLCLLIATAFAQSSKTDGTTIVFSSSKAVLPASFAGWKKLPGAKSSASPAVSDPANADVLKEYGFLDVEPAIYQREDRKISVMAVRFADTPGAYGAFTFYRQPQMTAEKLCAEGASNEKQVIFYCGNILVEVKLDKVTAMSGAQLRVLADALPKLRGEAAAAPNTPLYLPETMRANAKFVMGPLAFSKIDPPVSAATLDFSRSPEVVVASFRTLDGSAKAMVVQYPTPKIAGLQLKSMEASHTVEKSTPPINNSSGNAPASLNTFALKRSGPLVALVAGDVAASEAQDLLAKINYEANVTWSEPTFNGRRDNIGNLIVNILYLAGIVIFFMFVGGIAFGGLRMLSHRYFPKKRVAGRDDAEFIQLKLTE